MHVRYLLGELGVRGDIAFLATALLAPLEMVVLVQQTRIEAIPLDRIQAGWDDLVRRVVCTRSDDTAPTVVQTIGLGSTRRGEPRHQPGGCRSCQGAAASTWADRESSSSSSAGRAASITPTGRPSGVQCSGQRDGRHAR